MQLCDNDETAPVSQRAIPPEIDTWEITTAAMASVDSGMLMACAMGMNGTTIIGVGVKGTMWIWKARRLTL